MNNKFTSKEIDFLKKNSKNISDKSLTITAPEIYLSDILKNKTNEIHAFKRRIQETQLVEDKFVCMLFRISYKKKENKKDIDKLFEKTFQIVLQTDRGIWQRIEQDVYALVFWDYDNKNQAKKILNSIKEKMSSSIDIDICTGAAWHPFEDFLKIDSFDNAVKALDHAAFFGKNSTIFFDSLSIHIYGDRLYQLGYIEDASIEYQKSLELDKKNTVLINSLGVCYGLLGMLDKAKEEFKKVLTINPGEIISIYNLGLIYDLTNEKKKAIPYLKKAHAIDNNIFEIELLLGTLYYYKAGDIKNALHHLNKALELKKDSSHVLRIKGEIALDQNHFSKAVSNFTKAIKINPSDAVSLSGLAKAYEIQNKNIDIAFSFAKTSVELDPDNMVFKERLETINKKKKSA